ncbi:MAG: argininosuccinate lyase [Actinobacteria bacterium]|nr:argininosuccinate lyase [Actinomycetota bacterium]
MNLWGGRFKENINRSFLDFSASIEFDYKLAGYDVNCTMAWAKALAESGIIDKLELEEIIGGLHAITQEIKSNGFEFKPDDEDIHTAVERRLVEIVGPVGGKIRTGRSRNDQVATDLRLYAMEQLNNIDYGLLALIEALLDKAEKLISVIIPGHTHLQHAQPVLLSHLLMAFVHMIMRDRKRIKDAQYSADCMSLGSGALAGTGMDIDRMVLAGNLGFERISENSIDAVSDRDFVSDALYAISMIMVHLSRLAEQVILWCSQEFALVKLDDAWATGSSLMPQKKNPDAAELIRGKTGRVVGSLMSILTIMKALPLSYNKDLQEDKEGLFDSIDTVMGCLHVMERTIDTMEFDEDRAAQMVAGGFITATDLADYLVGKGMEFPQAHRIAGEIVVYCLDEDKELKDLSLEEFKPFCELFEEDVNQWLDVESSLRRRKIIGGTDPGEVSRSIKAAREALEGNGESL